MSVHVCKIQARLTLKSDISVILFSTALAVLIFTKQLGERNVYLEFYCFSVWFTFYYAIYVGVMKGSCDLYLFIRSKEGIRVLFGIKWFTSVVVVIRAESRPQLSRGCGNDMASFQLSSPWGTATIDWLPCMCCVCVLRIYSTWHLCSLGICRIFHYYPAKLVRTQELAIIMRVCRISTRNHRNLHTIIL